MNGSAQYTPFYPPFFFHATVYPGDPPTVVHKNILPSFLQFLVLYCVAAPEFIQLILYW